MQKGEESNRRRKRIRDLFKKIGDVKGTLHVKMGSIKDKKWHGPNRSGRD